MSRISKQKFFVTLQSNFLILAILGVSQILFEFIFAKNSSVAEFEKYILIRNIYFIVIPIATLGLNEVLVRRGSENIETGISLLCVVIIVEFLFTVLFYLFPLELLFKNQLPNKILLSIGLLTFMISQSFASFLRSQKYFSSSLIYRDGWRLFIWFGFIGIFGFQNITDSVFLSLLIIQILFLILGVISIIKLIKTELIFKRFLRIDKKDLLLGISFCFSLLLLVLASYLDQVFLNYISNNEGELKYYALSVTLITQPFLLLATVVGSILVPMIASGQRIKNKIIEIVSKRNAKMLFLTIIFFLVSIAFFFVSKNILKLVNIELNVSLFITLFLIGVNRIIYVIMSAVIGALATAKVLFIVSLSGFLLVFVQLVIGYLLYLSLGILGIAMATLFLVIARNIVGYFFIKDLDY